MKERAPLTRYTAGPDSMMEALSGCGGIEALLPSDRVPIKPNLVAWDGTYPIAPYGVYTTTRLIEDLFIALNHHGCGEITIGEGSVEILNGKKMKARHGYEKTMLPVNCKIRTNKNNPDVTQAVPVKGCSPSYNDVVNALTSVGLGLNELACLGYMKRQSEKYNGKEGFEPSFLAS
jgi:hypothetical protein